MHDRKVIVMRFRFYRAGGGPCMVSRVKGVSRNVRMRPELVIALATFNEMETGLYEDCQARFGLVFLLAVSRQIKEGRR